MNDTNSPHPDDSDPGTTTLDRLVAMDNPTWSALVERYFARVYQWCIDSGVDDHTAADISQEVFVSALGSLHRFQKSSHSSLRANGVRAFVVARVLDGHRRRPRRR